MTDVDRRRVVHVDRLARMALIRALSSGRATPPELRPDAAEGDLAPSRGGIVVGFTGTRQGCTEVQARVVSTIVAEAIAFAEGHRLDLMGLHGDCVGADARFDAICRELGADVACRPCTLERFRAHTGSRELALPASSKVRNAAIVADSSILIGTPPGPQIMRSGTWQTIRMGWRAGAPTIVAMPDGSASLRG